MTFNDIIARLSLERDFGSRFPVRLIFTESLVDYSHLVSELTAICDKTFNVADFCKTPDTVPIFKQIKTTLEDFKEKQIQLLSVGEYLRLCCKRELDPNLRQFTSFWESQQDESSRTRVIIPMFSCHEIFLRIVGTLDERQQDHVWFLDSEHANESVSIHVFSSEFLNSIQPDAANLTEWLYNWQSILNRNTGCSVITRHVRNTETSYGKVTIKAISTPFHFLKDLLIDGNRLVEEWENNEFWSRVVAYVSNLRNSVSFDQYIIETLNLQSFDFVSLAARWNSLDPFQKELIWLWYRVYPTEDYYSHACQKADKASDIPDSIRDAILLTCDKMQLWIKERNTAMKAFALSSFDERYFSLIDKVPDLETRLQLLTYQTHEECSYAIRLISELLRNGVEPESISSMISSDYPALAAYMTKKSCCDDDVDEYMTWYRKNKLINRYPGEFPHTIKFERFDARNKLIQKLKDKDTAFFWIDGFGVEYLPLILHELNKLNIVPESINIATALLPTETEFNHQWNENDPRTTKWDILDSYSHKGMPDDRSYYSCIAYQLEVFAKAARKVGELLEKHDCVVITSDHGSSRLAALAFHDSSVIPITPPQNSSVRNFGRFCILNEGSTDIIPMPETTKTTTTIGNKTVLVMNNYQHFVMSGNVAGGNNDFHDVVGETHGGNAPEERLIPVIVVKQHRLTPLACNPKLPYFTRKNGHIELILQFSQDLSTLEVTLDNNQGTCRMINAREWLIVFDNVSADKIVLSIIANGNLLSDVTLKCKPQGITHNKDPFSL